MKNSNVLILLSLTASLCLFSCERETQNEAQDSITTEISKIETLYVEGDIKIEGVGDDGTPKIETSASPEWYAKLEKELEATYSKQTAYFKAATNLVGVFKFETCGNYQEIWVRMDNEDGVGSVADEGGDIGSSYIGSDDNAYFYFCVVPGNIGFTDQHYDYGLLQLGNIYPANLVSRIDRKFDNEDNSNNNRATRDGTYITGMGDTWLGNNMLMVWKLYHGTYSGEELVFPNIGFSYGVLGSLGDTNNWIKTDDEDDSNDNLLYVYPKNNYALKTKYESNQYYYITGVLEHSINTKMYIAHVNQ